MMITGGHRFAWLGVLSGVIICCSVSTSALMTEKEILEKIYLQTGGSNWNNSDDWMDTDNYCNWYGVLCITEQVVGDQKGAGDDDRDDAIGDDKTTNSTVINANTDDAGEQTNANKTTTTVDDDATDDDTSTPNPYGSVSGLLLDANNLQGTMPSEVFSLTNLWKLDVKGNPNLKVPLSSIGNATKLEILILSNTNTTNSDLHGLGQASNLTQLHLTNMNLTGTIPANIFYLTQLQQLYLAFNKFTGSIPTQGLYNLSKLTDLYVYNNFISGSIPPDIGTKNTNLKYLTLGGNKINGTLPTSLNELKHLRSISVRNLRNDQDLGGVGLSGPLLDFPNAPYLVEIHLNHNNLTGTIPTTLLKKAHSGRYISVNLTSNMLNGTIPSELVRFTNLSLDLTDNRFVTGDLPEAFCKRADWMDGLVGKYGCKAILCPENTSSPLGRETRSFKCAECFLPGSYNDWDDIVNATDDTVDDTVDDTTRRTATDNSNFTMPPQTPYLGKLQCDEINAEDTGISEIALNTNLEREILTKFYHATGGSSWAVQDNWLDNTQGICSWYGIQCMILDGPHAGDAGVESILLEANKLNGTVPSSIYNLPLLAEVNFQRNDVFVTFDNIENATGTLKAMYLSQAKIDSLEKLALATNLTILHMSRTGLTGPFPEELFALTNLQELLLGENAITGTLPKKIETLIHMERFDVMKNNFTGKLPSFRQMKKLRILDLAANGWTGTLPASLYKQKELQVLSIFGIDGNGNLTGPLLDFANCSKLVELYLQDNKFTGTVPSTFLKYTEMKDHMVEINLRKNKLNGTLPQELGDRFDRLTIEIAGNMITEIPSSLCSKDQWMEGEVKAKGCNAISCPAGTWQAPFGRATKLLGDCKNCSGLATSPYLGNIECLDSNQTTTSNGATGGRSEKDILKILFLNTNGKSWRNNKNWLDDSKPICSWLGVTCADGSTASSGVTKLRLEYNNLAGQLPADVFDLPKLQQLSLARNTKLSMGFSNIGNATNLTTLYLAEVNLDLDGIGKAPSLATLGIPNSNLSGTFPAEILELTTLTELDLSFNNFHGSIPDEIAGLSSTLSSLLLNNNEFTGTITSYIGKLTKLKELDLSVNGFEGSLPKELNNLVNLELLAIKNQNNEDGYPSLSGPLLDFQNLTVLTELYLQDNALEGPVPGTFLMNSANKNSSAIYVGLSRNQLNGTLSAELGGLDTLIIDLDGNNITDIDSSLCKKPNWMEGNTIKFGCDGILCAIGTYQKYSGRQTSDKMPCSTCSLSGGAPFMGSTSCVSAADIITRNILSTLYESTGGKNWYRQGNWTNVDAPVCYWEGIECGHNHETIQRIKLGANNLVGPTPSEIFDIPGLQELWLYSNPIQFNFTGIERANNLTTLLLDNTGLSSLEGLGKGNSLVNLDLRFNSINGTFPYEEINPLVKLKALSLANNLITGGLVSYGIDKLGDLEMFRVDSNKMAGDLPDFADFPMLRSLDLSNNRFDSSIPSKFLSGIADTSNAIRVDLSDNELTGDISSSAFGRFQKLTLYVRGNMFSGIDDSLCNMSKWNNGDVGRYGCEGLSCSPGTSNDVGRRNHDSNICKRCELATYFGSTACAPIPSSVVSSAIGAGIIEKYAMWFAGLVGFIGLLAFV